MGFWDCGLVDVSKEACTDDVSLLLTEMGYKKSFAIPEEIGDVWTSWEVGEPEVVTFGRDFLSQESNAFVSLDPLELVRLIYVLSPNVFVRVATESGNSVVDSYSRTEACFSPAKNRLFTAYVDYCYGDGTAFGEVVEQSSVDEYEDDDESLVLSELGTRKSSQIFMFDDIGDDARRFAEGLFGESKFSGLERNAKLALASISEESGGSGDDALLMFANISGDDKTLEELSAWLTRLREWVCSPEFQELIDGNYDQMIEQAPKLGWPKEIFELYPELVQKLAGDNDAWAVLSAKGFKLSGEEPFLDKKTPYEAYLGILVAVDAAFPQLEISGRICDDHEDFSFSSSVGKTGLVDEFLWFA